MTPLPNSGQSSYTLIVALVVGYCSSHKPQAGLNSVTFLCGQSKSLLIWDRFCNNDPVALAFLGQWGQPPASRWKDRAKPDGRMALYHILMSTWLDSGWKDGLSGHRLMKTRLCWGYRVLVKRSNILPSWPRAPESSILILSELLIVLMNILEGSRNGSSGLRVRFQWPRQLMIHSVTRETQNRETELKDLKYAVGSYVNLFMCSCLFMLNI